MSKQQADIVALTRFRAALARPRGARRVDELLSATDARQAVRDLSVPGALQPRARRRVCRHHGARGARISGADTWLRRHGCMGPRPAFRWKRCFHGWPLCSRLATEKLGEIWEVLDPEFTALVLARTGRIYDLSLEEEVPEESEFPIVRTPDTFFAIELTSDNEDDIRLFRELIDHLYRADMTCGASHAHVGAFGDAV